jgi:hypothetical protein
MKNLLIALGLKAAPPPARPYFLIAATLGVVPAFLWMAWRNRRKLAAGVREAEHVAGDLLAGRSAKREPTTSASSISTSI